MPFESDDNQVLKPKDLVFILAIAGRLDAQSRIVAQQLHDDRSIYYGYAVLDSLSSSYSMYKYFFDIFIPNSNSDMLHEFMMTPSGFITAAIETLFLVSFSVLAVKFENEKKDDFKKFIAAAWPYFRSVMKALKNAYKGWRSTLLALKLLGITDINSLIVPIGLVLGIFAAINRFWLCSMVEARKSMMTENGQLKSIIKKLFTMTEDESTYYLGQIKRQSDTERLFAFLSVGLGGLIDGLYLYMGVLALAALSSPLLSFMVALCAFYTIACIVTRIYEEYDFQVRLLITQSKCKLEIIAKRTETLYAKLLSLQEKKDKTLEDLQELTILKAKIYNLLEHFDSTRKLLSKQSNRTYFVATLLGLKNGLYAYGALTSALFLLGIILTLSHVAFPPALLMIGAIIGLVFIASFITHSLLQNYRHLKKENAKETSPYNHLVDIKNKLELCVDADELPEMKSFQQSIQEGLMVDAAPQFFIQEWCEVLRSLFSGFGKGQKFVEFVGNSLQVSDGQGHYQDSTFMYVLSVFSAIIFGVVLAFRALARGLGRTPLGQECEKKKEPGPSNSQSTVLDTPKEEAIAAEQKDAVRIEAQLGCAKTEEMNKEKLFTQISEESIQVGKSQAEAQTAFPVPNHRSVFGFFETKNQISKKLHLSRSASEPSLTVHFTKADDTILGLN